MCTLLFTYCSHGINLRKEVLVASIYKRKTKSGQIVYYGALRINGKLIRRKLAHSLKLAKIELKKLEYNLHLEKASKKVEIISVKAAINKFLREYELSGVALEQVYNTKLKLNIFQNFCKLNNIKFINEITTGFTKEYVQYRSKMRVLRKYKACKDDYRPKISSDTLNKDIRLLKRVFKFCIEMEWIYKSPFKFISLVKEYTTTTDYCQFNLKHNKTEDITMPKQWLITPDKYLSELEIKRLITTLDNDSILAKSKGNIAPVRDSAIIQFALGSGLKVAELSNLKVEHLHFQRGSNQIVVYNGKGNKDRIVTINNKLKKLIQDYINYIQSKSDNLFPSERGEQLTRSGIQQIFKKWVKKAGLPKQFSIHSLRHTYATNLYKASGFNLRLIFILLNGMTRDFQAE